MKYLLIFLTSFIIATPVYAAKSVEGSVPVVKPLQPPSAFAHPDFSNNVQSNSTASQEGQPSQPSAAVGSSGQTIVTQPVTTSSSQNSFSGPVTTNRIFLWLLLIFVILGGIWLWRARGKQIL